MNEVEIFEKGTIETKIGQIFQIHAISQPHSPGRLEYPPHITLKSYKRQISRTFGDKPLYSYFFSPTTQGHFQISYHRKANGSDPHPSQDTYKIIVKRD